MARALRSGAVRLLGRHDGAPGRAFDAQYRALTARGLVPDAMTRQYGSAVAALWVDWQAAERTLAEAQRQRRVGRGRRPSAAGIARLQKRVGLAWGSYDAALRRLEELAQRNGAGRDLAARLAALPDVGARR